MWAIVRGRDSMSKVGGGGGGGGGGVGVHEVGGYLNIHSEYIRHR